MYADSAALDHSLFSPLFSPVDITARRPAASPAAYLTPRPHAYRHPHPHPHPHPHWKLVGFSNTWTHGHCIHAHTNKYQRTQPPPLPLPHFPLSTSPPFRSLSSSLLFAPSLFLLPLPSLDGTSPKRPEHRCARLTHTRSPRRTTPRCAALVPKPSTVTRDITAPDGLFCPPSVGHSYTFVTYTTSPLFCWILALSALRPFAFSSFRLLSSSLSARSPPTPHPLRTGRAVPPRLRLRIFDFRARRIAAVPSLHQSVASIFAFSCKLFFFLLCSVPSFASSSLHFFVPFVFLVLAFLTFCSPSPSLSRFGPNCLLLCFIAHEGVSH